VQILIPEVYTPLKADGLLASFMGLVRPKASDLFKQKLETLLGRRVLLFSSGRAALYFLLQVASKRYDQRAIVIPAYTCPEIATTVIAAGCEPVLCDTRQDSFALDPMALSQIINTIEPLAVLTNHLFGAYHDISELANQSRRVPLFIQDAAQSLPVSETEHAIFGSAGIGILSFGRGKTLSTMGGGCLVVDERHHLFSSLEESYKIELGELTESLFIALQIAAYPIVLWPPVWKYLHFLLKFPSFNSTADRYTNVQAVLGAILLDRLEQVVNERIDSANSIINATKRFDLYILPEECRTKTWGSLRLPLLFSSQKIRDSIYNNLLGAGIGVSKMYPPPPKGNHYPNAVRLSQQLLALPVGRYFIGESLNATIEAFSRFDPNASSQA
jgi:dTDP-4-amino-4,6-dideoxygalactose transaminase